MGTGFSKTIKKTVLLWCDRHCCVCEKSCGPNIEVHHIIPPREGGSNAIDNAIPLCFDCHGVVPAYNKNHPTGSKYTAEELIKRREKIYDKYTDHLVPAIGCQISQITPLGTKRTFPDVGFTLVHSDDSLPVRVKTVLNVLLGGKRLGSPDTGYYAGNKHWRLNPGQLHHGHFRIHEKAEKSKKRLEVEVNLTITDQYGREHKRQPVGFVYVRDKDYWYFEP